MHMAFTIHPFGYTCFTYQVDKSLFQNASTNTAKDVIASYTFYDDIADSLARQKLSRAAGRMGPHQL